MGPATEPMSGMGPPAGQSMPFANAWRFPLDGNSDSNGSIDPSTGAMLWAVEDDSDSDSGGDPSLSHDELDAIGALSRREHAAVVLPTRGETMEHARQEAAKQEVAETTTKAAKPKKKKRKKSGFFNPQETLTLVGGVSVVVLVLALVAWWFPQFRFPFGALLAVIGAVLYLMAAISLRRLTEQLGFFKSFLFRFFPPYQLWFVLTRWEETRDYFAFILSGLISVAVGVAIVITSPTYKAAEASERGLSIHGRRVGTRWGSLRTAAGDQENGRWQELVTQCLSAGSSRSTEPRLFRRTDASSVSSRARLAQAGVRSCAVAPLGSRGGEPNRAGGTDFQPSGRYRGWSFGDARPRPATSSRPCRHKPARIRGRTGRGQGGRGLR